MFELLMVGGFGVIMGAAWWLTLCWEDRALARSSVQARSARFLAHLDRLNARAALADRQLCDTPTHRYAR